MYIFVIKNKYMAKIASSFKNMLIVLTLVSIFAATALAGVYVLTKEKIKEVSENKLSSIISVVVPNAEKCEIIKDTIASYDDSTKFLYFFTVTKGDKIIGTAVQSYTNNGFGGEIKVMIGFDSLGNIIDSDVLEHHETPGLGNKTAKSVSDWNKQFIGKNPQSPTFNIIKAGEKKEGDNIDAITAATISSKAYIDAIIRASETYQKFIKRKGENQL